MNSGKNRCDHSQIDELLKSAPGQFEETVIISHLDHCPDCRNYLEHHAADMESWDEAARSLRETEFDVASSMEYSAAGIDSQKVSTSAAIQSVLDSLTPSEHPDRLGRLEGYEVTGVVGAGAMGVVLKAIDPALDRIVAIKVMATHIASHATARKRFAREAKAAAAVLHPNVIPIHAVSNSGAIPFLVMSYVRGGSLQKRIDREGALTTAEILRIGSQVAAGLAAAHDQGLVHRDIKPENILLDEGVERVTLTDFGLARSVDDASITQQGTITGTSQYMSPEQARGEFVDQASDLFSLGSVLYTLCTGRVPFRADSSLSVMRKIIDEEPAPILELNPEIPGWLRDIIAQLMAKNKTDRFKSAKDVHDLLEACLSHIQQPTVNKLPDGLRALSRSKSTSSLPLILGVCAMAVCSALVLWLSGGLGLIVQEPAPKTTPVVQQESTEASPAEAPLTWKALLGEEAPENYPTEPLQAIDGLNKTVGNWGFAGEQLLDGKGSEFEAVMQVQGGLSSDTISLGRMPSWHISILWPAMEPVFSLNFTVVPAIEPDGVKWLLFAASANDGKKHTSSESPVNVDPDAAFNVSKLLWAMAPGEKFFFEGTWDPASRTLNWKPQTPQMLGTKVGPAEHGREFQMIISENGGLQIRNFHQNDKQQISGQTAVRLGEYLKPGTDLKMLPNGYKIFFASSSEVLLVDKENGGVAGARVDKIGCSGSLIFGLITHREQVEKPEDTLGYFWLDSTTGEITKGMELGGWKDALKAKGVAEPMLLAPERVGPRL
jgi:serine/threonine protein kinase